MALNDFGCTECGGGGYRDNGDGELVGCYRQPSPESSGVVMDEIDDYARPVSAAVAALFAATEAPALTEMPLADEHITMTAPIPSDREGRITVEIPLPLDALLERRLVGMGGGL